MPYFPYSRQSKKKSHRGSITARMLANLLDVAGVNHVITIDLHASQMQGFFHCPVDNLVAEPLIAQWIKTNIPEWRSAVVVSKNPGGTKRVTSLADALKLSFGIVMTDRRRPGSGRNSMNASTIFEATSGRPQRCRSSEDSSTSVTTVNGQLPATPSSLRQVVGADGLSDTPQGRGHVVSGTNGNNTHVESAANGSNNPYDDSEDEDADTVGEDSSTAIDYC